MTVHNTDLFVSGVVVITSALQLEACYIP